jgi:hypothetical protein
MKKIIYLLAVIVLCLSASADAKPAVKEISFKRDCAEGVPLYNAASGKIACGKMAKSGAGYILEMMTQSKNEPSCPMGFNYIGNLDESALTARGIVPKAAFHFFACAKSA